MADSDKLFPQGPGDQDPQRPPGEDIQQVRLNRVGARLPDEVGEGVLSTGALVLTAPNEFVMDFVQNLGRPFRLVARLVVPPPVMGQFVAALEQNLVNYTNRFGAPMVLPKPADPPPRRSIQEIYEELKIPETLMSGRYANAVMIRHSPAEFWIDFITHFFPQAAVSARVFMAPPYIPGLLESMRTAFRQFQQRQNRPPQDPPPWQPEGPGPAPGPDFPDTLGPLGTTGPYGPA